METIICIKCGKEKEATCEFFDRKKSWFYKKCKNCINDGKVRKNYIKKCRKIGILDEIAPEEHKHYKICNQCQKRRSVNLFKSIFCLLCKNCRRLNENENMRKLRCLKAECKLRNEYITQCRLIGIAGEIGPNEHKEYKFCRWCTRKHISEFKNNKCTTCNNCKKNIRNKNRKKHYDINSQYKYKETRAEYYKNNKEKIKHLIKAWLNTPNGKLKSAERQKRHRQKTQKYKTDPVFKLRNRISGSIRDALKSRKCKKNNESIRNYLPYTMNELKLHLESQFESWMNWKNHGRYTPITWNDNDPSTWTWQIDHIIPQSDLPYDSMEHPNFKKCWALENLRPLSAKQNVIEGSCRIRHKKVA